MKKFQKALIIVVLVLPVLIGIAMLVPGDPKSSLSAVSFKRLGLVTIDGELMESSEYVRELRTLRLDNTIAGVLLRIDSPGGAVAPSQEIYSEVARFRESGKPVVVTMGSVAASGGYYIASAGSKIFADPGTLTGSIGVIFTLPMIADLTKKIGIEIRTYKAGKYKDIGNMNRPMTAEEQKLLQGLLDDTHEQFISDVAKGRKLNRDSVAAIADGRVFTGKQALKVHLVDTLGGYEDALQYLQDQCDVSSKSKLVTKRPRSSVLRELVSENITRLFPILAHYRSAGMYYLFDAKL